MLTAKEVFGDQQQQIIDTQLQLQCQLNQWIVLTTLQHKPSPSNHPSLPNCNYATDVIYSHVALYQYFAIHCILMVPGNQWHHCTFDALTCSYPTHQTQTLVIFLPTTCSTSSIQFNDSYHIVPTDLWHLTAALPGHHIMGMTYHHTKPQIRMECNAGFLPNPHTLQ